MFKKSFAITLLALCFMVLPFTALAQTEGIPLQKDVILGAPIYGPQDLPEEVTFTLYDAQNGLTPLGSQTFPRGQYTVDFEFSQSNGVTGGSVARVKADFTNILNLKDAFGQTLKPTEIWAALEVGGTEVGARTKVSDETLVRLLLNSDASLATYLTLAYQGDDNPIASIYKNLPISLMAADGSKKSLSDYFSGVVVGTAGGGERANGTMPDWESAGNNIWYTYNSGYVGIGTASPQSRLDINANNIQGRAKIRFSGLPSATNVFFETFTQGGTPGMKIGSSGGSQEFFDVLDGAGKIVFRVNTLSGNVCIGTESSAYQLSVNGTGRFKQLIVDSDWADFVFDEDYRLPNLVDVEKFILRQKHLPGIPSEVEVKENGISVGNMASKLLQKVEELTLYLIDINKENESLKAKLANLEAQLKELKK